MRRFIRAFLLILLMSLLSGCLRTGGGGEPGGRETEGEEKLKVVTTLFPYYDFVKQTAGERVDLTMVVPAGMDSHSFEPTPADMRLIQEADLLVCNGGEMEHWLREVLEAVDTSGMTVVTMMDYVEAREEETVEGMEDEEEEHGHGGQETGTGESYVSDGHELNIEYDEHIWTSPVNAVKMVEVICAALQKADPAGTQIYGQNAEAYEEKLQKLDKEFREVTENGERNIIIVGDKFPFRYLADQYHLQYRAAFSGCSTDTEPSARTIAYLIEKIKSEKIPVIYYLELSSSRVSEIIAEETGAEALLLHSCHNVTRREFDRGVTYLELMEQSVENLRRGLD